MPFIVSWPAKIKEGFVSDHLGNFADVMPTICELAGVDAPKNDGVSLVPLLSNNAEAQQEHEYLYWEYPAAGGMIAVREGKWKGLIKDVHKGNRTMKLFAVSTPGKDIEFDDKDVAAEHPEIIERMWGYIEQSHHLAEYEPFNVDITR
jgi:arylsulfatase